MRMSFLYAQTKLSYLVLIYREASHLFSEQEYLSDYPDCGRRYKRPLEHECFWGCEWVPNPFYRYLVGRRMILALLEIDLFRKNFTVQLKGTDESPGRKVFFNVASRMIPKDLSCLSTCKMPGSFNMVTRN